MRLPWGGLDQISRVFLAGVSFEIVGCLSFEERCCTVPTLLYLARRQNRPIQMVEVHDPVNAFPDFSGEIRRRIEENRDRLADAGVALDVQESELLAGEDALLDIVTRCENQRTCSTVVLDITSFPKRYFCFLLKRMILRNSFENIIVTYTTPKANGYAAGHLAEDPMTCDHLPGFAAPLRIGGTTLVVSVGFESLSIRSLLEVFPDRKELKVILSFPPNREGTRRQWSMLRQFVAGKSADLRRENLEYIAAWDAEVIYQTLWRWSQNSEGLTLAPFGPKPHSLGMALYALKADAGLYYTQPKSYHPDYCTGAGHTWAYVVKWGGVACFDRVVAKS